MSTFKNSSQDFRTQTPLFMANDLLKPALTAFYNLLKEFPQGFFGNQVMDLISQRLG